jgi:hypothetical protein
VDQAVVRLNQVRASPISIALIHGAAAPVIAFVSLACAEAILTKIILRTWIAIITRTITHTSDRLNHVDDVVSVRGNVLPKLRVRVHICQRIDRSCVAGAWRSVWRIQWCDSVLTTVTAHDVRVTRSACPNQDQYEEQNTGAQPGHSMSPLRTV